MSFLVFNRSQLSEAMPNTVPGMMPGPQPHVQYAAMPSGAKLTLHCCDRNHLSWVCLSSWCWQGCWYPETFADNFRYQTSSPLFECYSNDITSMNDESQSTLWQPPWQVGKFHGCNGEDDLTWLFAVLSMDPNDWIWNEAVPAVGWFDLSTLHHCAIFHCNFWFLLQDLQQ